MVLRNTGRSLHQVIIGAMPGDAITDQAFLIRGWLREMGFTSHIYAEFVHPALTEEIQPFKSYRPRPSENYLIYHLSIGTPIAEQLMCLPLRLILIYHNVTPAEFFDDIDPALAQQMKAGRTQLLALREHTELALADSPYNEQDLCQVGFKRTGVLPITLNERNYVLPPNEESLARFQYGGPRLLFVGRLVPNKKQQDLIKLLYFYRRIEPSARLLLVGDPWVASYVRSLRELAVRLGLCDSVFFIGHVSQQELVTFYRMADVYVSMSEHEGFGKPLIESMYLGLPVMAFAAAAVPGTMGDAGVLFHQKDFAVLAEVVNILVNDQPLRQRIIAQQRTRTQAFLESHAHQIWARYLREIISYPFDN